MSDVTIFDFINQIFYKTSKYKYDKKISPSYMLSMWLAHDSQLIDIVNEINQYQFSLPDEIIYQYYFDKVPKGRRFLKWTKKKEEDKKLKDYIWKIREERGISKKEILSMFSVFNKKEFILSKKNVSSNLIAKTFFMGGENEK